MLASDAYTQGLAAFAAAQVISSIADITAALSAIYWNEVCWRGSMTGLATEVMSACERAVALAPEDGRILDSRGLALALTGDIQGAIEDFAFAVQSAEAADLGADFVESRTAWIAMLKDRKNPFDEATLDKLRNN